MQAVAAGAALAGQWSPAGCNSLLGSAPMIPPPPSAALVVLLLAADSAHGAAPPCGYSPPLYNITADSLLDAGRQQGSMAGPRIRAWFASSEMQRVVQFTQGDGKAAYLQIRNDSAAMYPQYASELQGIAEGGQSAPCTYIAR